MIIFQRVRFLSTGRARDGWLGVLATKPSAAVLVGWFDVERMDTGAEVMEVVGAAAEDTLLGGGGGST